MTERPSQPDAGVFDDAPPMRAWLERAGASVDWLGCTRRWTAHRLARLKHVYTRLHGSLAGPDDVDAWWHTPVRRCGGRTPAAALAQGAIGTLWVAVRQWESATHRHPRPSERPPTRCSPPAPVRPQPSTRTPSGLSVDRFGWTVEDYCYLDVEHIAVTEQSIEGTKAYAVTSGEAWAHNPDGMLDFFDRQRERLVAQFTARLAQLDRDALSPFLSHPNALVRRLAQHERAS